MERCDGTATPRGATISPALLERSGLAAEFLTKQAGLTHWRLPCGVKHTVAADGFSERCLIMMRSHRHVTSHTSISEFSKRL